MSDVNWAEKRNALRQRTLKRGRIVVSGMSTMDCLIRNMSLTGARLAVPNAHALPDEFELLIGDEGLRRECEVMSRSDSSAGVRFTKPLSPRELGAEFMSTKRSATDAPATHSEPDQAASSDRVALDPPPLAEPQAGTLAKIKAIELPRPVRKHLPWAARKRARSVAVSLER